jgi:glycosyltransferase involved in cell wall biosynthesis
MPEVSVVIPTRNRADRLPLAISSVLAQEGVELELVVVDDASRDATPEILERLASADRRVHVVRSVHARGAAATRNAGAAVARAPLLAFNDDDCVWEPTKLKSQLERMRASEAGVVYCREAIHWPKSGVSVNGSPDAERRGAVRSLVTANYIGTISPLIDRSLFEQVGGFDESLPALEDWDLWLRLGLLTRFAYVPEVLVRGEFVPGGISGSPDRLRKAARLMLEKWRADGRMSRRELALLHYGMGKYLLAEGLGADAREALREGLRIDPTSPLNWLGLLASPLGRGPINLLKRARIALRRSQST